MAAHEQFTTREFVDEVARLELPDPSGVVINHSAALATWGRLPSGEIGDIDAAISHRNMLYLRRKAGWGVLRKTVGYRVDGRPVTVMVTQDDERRFDFHRWDFSTVRYNETGRGRVYLSELKQMSVQDGATGIYIASANYVIETMRDTGREKDLRRLHTIDNQ